MGADRYHLQRRTAIFTQDILVTKAKRERSTIHVRLRVPMRSQLASGFGRSPTVLILTREKHILSQAFD